MYDKFCVSSPSRETNFGTSKFWGCMTSFVQIEVHVVIRNYARYVVDGDEEITVALYLVIWMYVPSQFFFSYLLY